MKYYLFRNSTIEPLFQNIEILYSGYGVISEIEKKIDSYIWFYTVPIKTNPNLIISEIESYYDQLLLVLKKIDKNKPIYIITLCDIFSITYESSKNLIVHSIQNFNAQLFELSGIHRNIKILDINVFLRNYPISDVIDWRYYFISQTVINPKLASQFLIWFNRQIETIQFKRKKCLVLDLDNTLWGGILGEDGIDGIRIGGDYPGNAYLLFQQFLLEFSKKGIILTACSKNNTQDVLDLWRENPYNILKKENFASFRINWNNKVDNIKEIAEELNIGLDSIVFVDDNPSERELIKQFLPMVSVPELPQHPYQLPQFAKHIYDTYFSSYIITAEDTHKTSQYIKNAQRNRHQSNFTDFNSYIRSLNIEIEVQFANSFNIERIAQMTQKTNQFNLTTKRYSDTELNAFKEKGGIITCINVKDKFGDNGITGAIIIIITNSYSAKIDSFLLSCRILGKNIESIFLNEILKMLSNKGFKTVCAEYISTEKNEQVADFYEKAGFEKIEGFELSKKSYQLSLDNFKYVSPSQYKVTWKN